MEYNSLTIADTRRITWHATSVDEVLRALKCDSHAGLSEAEALRRREAFGANVLEKSHGRSVWSILVAQFTSLIVGLLLAATLVAFLMGESVEAAAILVVILLNAIIGFVTEWKAEITLSALEKQMVPTAHVLRDGRSQEIAAADLVPGDIAQIAAGHRVPADGRVIDGVRLQVDEAALTGESVASEKSTATVDDAVAALGDRHSMVYLGTVVTDGRGRFVVTETGARTEMGRIGKLLELAGHRESPLDRKLNQLGRSLVLVVLVLCAIIVVAGWLRGHSFLRILEIGISLAIAAVPEGLPAVATMTLALGMQRMARRRAIVRRLSAVETLGSTTVICTDKTGTLTRNEMTVRVVQLGERRIDVGGVGYEPHGDFQVNSKPVDALSDASLRRALQIGALCNDAKLVAGPPPSILGDPTEGALVVAAEKAGLRHDDLHEQFPRVREVPFSSASQRMTTVHRTAEGGTVAFVKGAPGVLLELCAFWQPEDRPEPLDDQARQCLRDLNDKLAGSALRVLALAYRELPDSFDDAELEKELIFVGLVGMMDPLREEAKAAIATCGEAGIRVVMITGDQPATAREIGRQLGLGDAQHGRPPDTVHGRDLANLDDQGWSNLTAEAAIFARVSPEHKLRIVDALQRQGAVVAMTGDGVNDAPALKKADIGVAMGIKGTEVAKEASAMIITDDNFATIVGAVEQGRIIYSNIVRFIHYLFSCNFSEIITVFVPIVVGWPLPLVALQILWLNMITDVFPAMALALEPSAPGLMKRLPRDPKQPLLNLPFLWMITWQAVLLAGGTLVSFYLAMRWHGVEGAGLRLATTITFMTLALAQVFHVYSARSQRRSAFLSSPFTNPWLWGAVLTCLLLQLAAVYFPPLNKVLHTSPLSQNDWLLVGACSLAPAVVIEAVKFTRHLIYGDN